MLWLIFAFSSGFGANQSIFYSYSPISFSTWFCFLNANQWNSIMQPRRHFSNNHTWSSKFFYFPRGGQKPPRINFLCSSNAQLYIYWYMSGATIAKYNNNAIHRHVKGMILSLCKGGGRVWMKERPSTSVNDALRRGVHLVFGPWPSIQRSRDPPSLALVIIFWRGARENSAPSRVCEIFCGPRVITVIGRAIENEVRYIWCGCSCI